MARRPRVVRPGVPVHVIHRGNDRIAMFRAPSDHVRYLAHLCDARSRFDVQVHAYVMMTNHVHLLLTPTDAHGASRTMQLLGARYVRYFNTRYGRTGTLWEGRFRSSVVDTERYLLTCCRYIELNPVRAGMVAHAHEYPWSSYRRNAMGVGDPLVTPHGVYLALGKTPGERCDAYASLFRGTEPGPEVTTLREAIRRGRSVSETMGTA